jgi:hypothetical protein
MLNEKLATDQAGSVKLNFFRTGCRLSASVGAGCRRSEVAARWPASPWFVTKMYTFLYVMFTRSRAIVGELYYNESDRTTT